MKNCSFFEAGGDCYEEEVITYGFETQLSHSLGSEEVAKNPLWEGAARDWHDMRRLCRYKGVELFEGDVRIDHIHICLSIPPKYSVSTIVGYLKGKGITFSSFILNLKIIYYNDESPIIAAG